jgi:hypothetical protein
MPRLKVGVSFHVDPDLLDLINRNIPAKTQSERIRKCVEEGFKVLKR